MTEREESRWPFVKRIGFRFLFIYVVLYVLPFPYSYVPTLVGLAGEIAPLSRLVETLSEPLAWPISAHSDGWRAAAQWTTTHILHIEEPLFLGMTGSGDTTYDYVRLFMMSIIALVGTAIWSAIDFRRGAYRVLGQVLVIVCRFYLGLTILGYGLAKIPPTQFQQPGLVRLLTPYGDSSPMGLAWTFMGFSPAFCIFVGLGEAIGGCLLFFRRTRLLGAAVLIPVMTTVVAVNFCFDVPVKLFSGHLLLMAIGLLLLDGKRLRAVFIFNRPAPPADMLPLLRPGWLNLTAQIAKGVVIGLIIFSSVRSSIEAYRSIADGRPRPPLWGIHDVESFIADGEALPAVVTDTARWKALIIDRALPTSFAGFDRPGMITIQRLDGSFTWHQIEFDTDNRVITFLRPQGAPESVRSDVLAYERPEENRLVLSGTFEGRNVEIQLRERDLGSNNLIGRGYHWINELPYHR